MCVFPNIQVGEDVFDDKYGRTEWKILSCLYFHCIYNIIIYIHHTI